MDDVRIAATALGVVGLAEPTAPPPTSPPLPRVGASVEDLELPDYAALAQAQSTIQLSETAGSLAWERRTHPEQLSEALASALGDGAGVSRDEYAGARSSRGRPPWVAPPGTDATMLSVAERLI